MKKNNKEKKINSYKRFLLIMLLAAVAGGIIGAICSIVLGDNINNIENGITTVMTQFQRILLPLMIIITIVSVIYGEINLRKQREIGKKILETEDEECDRWEYEEEKVGARGMMANVLSQVLCILVLSVGYSAKYIEKGNHESFLIVCLVFLACFVYDGLWQVRYVKIVQKTYPDKKGDPSSRKFRQQWLDSCDEAEKEVIYQSAYRTYTQLNTWIPVLLVITMITHLFLDTGIMAIVMVALIWLIEMLAYLRSCVKLKGAKL